MEIKQLRKIYHQNICENIIRFQPGKYGDYPNFADGSNKNSTNIACEIAKLIGCEITHGKIDGQTAGDRFEDANKDFLEQSFELLRSIRPGDWYYSTDTKISEFEQYSHLAYLDEVIKKDKKLGAALRGGYIIKPDIIIGRWPVSDDELNLNGIIINETDNIAKLTPIRRANRPESNKILHASISCKWTIRSDRSQNTRTEALNLIRNRKGSQPHIVMVTAEPTSHRLASVALGTGDLDCVYHFALYELIESVKLLGLEDPLEEIQMMVEGKRLRDISDLPFDLAI